MGYQLRVKYTSKRKKMQKDTKKITLNFILIRTFLLNQIISMACLLQKLNDRNAARRQGHSDSGGATNSPKQHLKLW